MTTPELRVVATWHEALDSGDADRLVEFSLGQFDCVIYERNVVV